MSEKSQEVLDLEAQSRLEYTHNVRKRVIDELMKEGIPKGTSDKVLLIQALDGIDKAVFTKVKLKNEDKANKNEEERNRILVTSALAQYKANQANHVRTGMPDTSNLPKVDLVPDQTYIGTQNLTYEDITKENED